MILSLFRRRRKGEDIEPLYGAIMAAGLDPALYAEHGVADSFEGRFEAVTLAAAIALHRLKGEPPPADAAAQQLVDRIFDGLDSAKREVGISDPGIPRRMKKFAQGFYGRLGAYSQALDQTERRAALAAAIQRNLLDGRTPTPGLIDHVEALAGRIAAPGLDDFLAGRWSGRAQEGQSQ